MFERFTDPARQTVVLAQEQARRLQHGHIGTEHLLLALAGQEATASATVLAAHGLTPQVIVGAITARVQPDDLDAEALTALGINLAAVRTTAEATFGPGALDKRPPGRREPAVAGHIPFTPRARKVLELSLREALALKHRYIADGHILLGLLREGEGLAAEVIHDRGIDTEALRREVRTALSSCGAGPAARARPGQARAASRSIFAATFGWSLSGRWASAGASSGSRDFRVVSARKADPVVTP